GDAPALIADLKLLSPTHGSVPDARGRQTALAWLAAGAALADIPASHGANHFFDPTTGRGWERPSRGVVDLVAKLSLPELGVPGPSRTVTKPHLRDFYVALAQQISTTYFSPNTLPEPSRSVDARPKLRRPRPTLPARLNLMAASRDEGTTLRAEDGTCLAR